MSINTQMACPMCDSIYVQDKFSISNYNYMECKVCKSFFAINNSSIYNAKNLYSKEYYESKNTNENGQSRYGYNSYEDSEKTLIESFKNKLNVVQSYSSSGRLLDAGAAYGYFVKIAEEFYESIGIDVSDYAASTARNKNNVNVTQCDITKTNFENEYFNVIVMWDIIEHIPNPQEAIKECWRILSPDGYLFISTDDAANWLPRILGKHWWALSAPLHLCHISKTGLGYAAVKAGFEPPVFLPDKRTYTVCEIIKHFGVAYQSKTLRKTAEILGRTFLRKTAVSITRPEQFIAIIHKK